MYTAMQSQTTTVPALLLALLLLAPPTVSAMNKAELVDAIASSAGLSPSNAGAALDIISAATTTTVRTDSTTTVVGSFGIFSVSESEPQVSDTAVVIGEAYQLGVSGCTYAAPPSGNDGRAGKGKGKRKGKGPRPSACTDDDDFDSVAAVDVTLEGGLATMTIEIPVPAPGKTPDEAMNDIRVTVQAKKNNRLYRRQERPSTVTLPAFELQISGLGHYVWTIGDDSRRVGGTLFVTVGVPLRALYGDGSIDNEAYELGAGWVQDTSGCGLDTLSAELRTGGVEKCVIGPDCDCDGDAALRKLAAHLAKRGGFDPDDAEDDAWNVIRAVQAAAGTMTIGSSQQLVGFGSFSISARSARVGRNPQTGSVIKTTPKKVAKFKAGKALADTVK
jgi:DNA-binding protein HU-beta